MTRLGGREGLLGCCPTQGRSPRGHGPLRPHARPRPDPRPAAGPSGGTGRLPGTRRPISPHSLQQPSPQSFPPGSDAALKAPQAGGSGPSHLHRSRWDFAGPRRGAVEDRTAARASAPSRRAPRRRARGERPLPSLPSLTSGVRQWQSRRRRPRSPGARVAVGGGEQWAGRWAELRGARAGRQPIGVLLEARRGGDSAGTRRAAPAPPPTLRAPEGAAGARPAAPPFPPPFSLTPSSDFTPLTPPPPSPSLPPGGG